MNRLLKILVAILVLFLAAVTAAVVWAWKNPLALHAWSTRAALEKAGLVQSSAETPSGRLSFWEGGSGPDLVFLHGAGDQAGAWNLVAPSFAGEFHVVVLDLPGHGDSEPAEGTLHFSTILDGVTSFLDARRGSGPAVLVGNSLGAWLSFLYAAEHPDRVARIVAVNGGPLQGDPGDLTLTPQNLEEARALIDGLRDPASAPVPDWVLDDIVDQSSRGPIGRMMGDVQGMVDHIMQDEDLAGIEVPVDLLWGRSDRLFPEDYVRRLESGLPRVRLTWIEHCGHIPANECPTPLREHLQELLSAGPP
jgi:pimeloyl-ACP methyl ester carboxylesterase